MLVALTRGDGPLQRQVEDQLRAAIRSGRLVAGERLPASRTLAADLGVSRGVVSDAYMQLAAEGYLLVAPRTSPIVATSRGQTPQHCVRPKAPAQSKIELLRGLTPERVFGMTCGPGGRIWRGFRGRIGCGR